MTDLIWIAFAFVFGLLANMVRIPPLIGYLVAGFFLHAFGFEKSHLIELYSEFGIILLLFIIGLKLDFSSLKRPETFLSTLIHSSVSIFALYAVLWSFAIPSQVAMLIAFALSFSSTVFVLTFLEKKGDINSRYGMTAIGILVIQDILAAIFLAFCTDKLPTGLSLLILASIWPIRFVLYQLFSRIRHDELLFLFGMSAALCGVLIFDLANIKGDLGALVIGMLLSKHARSNELRKSLSAFKNFFLLGFFLSIGMGEFPTLEQVGIAALICVALPFRSALYFFLFARFGMRSQTAFFGSAALLNYSEFGLIVLAAGVKQNWIGSEWLTICTIALSMSFVLSSILNAQSGVILSRFETLLLRFQRLVIHPDDKEITFESANVLVLGMGRIGISAYQTLLNSEKWIPLGCEVSPKKAIKLRGQNNMNVMHGNVTSSEFWSRVVFDKNRIEMIILCLPLSSQNIAAAKLIRNSGFHGKMTSVAQYQDEIDPLEAAGIDRAYFLFSEAGVGLAQNSIDFNGSHTPN